MRNIPAHFLWSKFRMAVSIKRYVLYQTKVEHHFQEILGPYSYLYFLLCWTSCWSAWPDPSPPLSRNPRPGPVGWHCNYVPILDQRSFITKSVRMSLVCQGIDDRFIDFSILYQLYLVAWLSFLEKLRHCNKPIYRGTPLLKHGKSFCNIPEGYRWAGCSQSQSSPPSRRWRGWAENPIHL